MEDVTPSTMVVAPTVSLMQTTICLCAKCAVRAIIRFLRTIIVVSLPGPLSRLLPLANDANCKGDLFLLAVVSPNENVQFVMDLRRHRSPLTLHLPLCQKKVRSF